MNEIMGREQHVDPPQPSDEPDLPPVPPHDPNEPDPMNPERLPPTDTEPELGQEPNWDWVKHED